ncbi:hypothetical protein CAEBREN_15559 [Caenorhabditis brenneri]|uniref:Uncharacterized protein n=1 Tax=Caenorhabditis brenneri TaxID=135651 RepID=G0MY99_CAEBE|nr:hypothetical protein CAEBREN_15559 [Caenorhabditis brenneri]
MTSPIDRNGDPLPDPAVFLEDNKVEDVEELRALLEELFVRYEHLGREMEELVDLEINIMETTIEIDNYEKRRQDLLMELEELQNTGNQTEHAEEDHLEEVKEEEGGNEGDDEKEDSDDDFSY